MAHRETSLYRNDLKNRDYAKEAAQIFGLERATIAEWQGASESRKFAAKPTMAETDSSDYFGINSCSTLVFKNLSIGLMHRRHHVVIEAVHDPDRKDHDDQDE